MVLWYRVHDSRNYQGKYYFTGGFMKRYLIAALLSAVLLAGCTASQPESSSGQSTSEKTDSPEDPAFQAETESGNSTSGVPL